MKKRFTGLTCLVIVEIAALAVIMVLGILKLMKPTVDTRTIQTTEATTEAIKQEATPEDAATETTTEAAVQEPEPSKAIKDQLSNMTLEEKVSLLFVVSPETLTSEDRVTIAGDKTRNYLSRYHVGGLSYSHMNYEDDTQIKDLLDNTQTMTAELMPYQPLMFARDDSDGTIVNASSQDLSGLRRTLIAEDGVKNAKQSTSVHVITQYPTADAVSEDAGPVIFETVKGDDDTLTCLSAKTVTDYRKAHGYYGIIMTGRMDDAAVTGQYTAVEAMVQAIKAGVDMIYEPENFEEAFTAVVQAVGEGELSEEDIDKAAGRVLTYMEQIGYWSGTETGEGNEE